MSFPTWYTKLPVSVIQSKAIAYRVDPYLIAAICRRENVDGGWAPRYEPGSEKDVIQYYSQIAVSLGISASTEKVLEMCSWGHMQVMGWVARKMGYKLMLTRLIQPDFGIEYGTRLLRDLLLRYDGQVQDAISAYNQGSPRKDEDGRYANQPYVDAVVGWLSELQNSGKSDSPV